MITALLICAASVAPQNQPYRWLDTAELEALLRGKRIFEADARHSLDRTPEEFHQNGWYVRHSDNYEANGRYSFRDDAVCDHAMGEDEVCRRVLVDKNGRYWIVGRYNPRVIVKMTIEPLRR